MTQGCFVGEALREGREERGMTLEDIFRRIHIPVRYVHALEEGDLQALPGKTYAIGFLTSYCEFLEIAPEPLVAQYRAATHVPAHRFFTTAPNGTETRPPAWLAELITWGAICGFLLFGWFAYSAIVRPLAANTPAYVEAGVDDIAPPTHFEEDF